MLTIDYTIDMVNVVKCDEFIDWIRGLRDSQARTRINARIRRIEETGNLGDFHGVGDGILELRFFFNPGYRVYFIFEGNETVVLLNSGRHDTQQRDIEAAKQIAQQWRV